MIARLGVSGRSGSYEGKPPFFRSGSDHLQIIEFT
jgi:hypothetical protein